MSLKRLILIVGIILALPFWKSWGYAGYAQTYVTIPDANFAAYLQTAIPAAMSGNQMDTSNILVTTITQTISVSNKSIADLTGIQYFKSLTCLDCGNNQLTSLPTLPSSLQILSCNLNNITTLPILPSVLKNLVCYNNQLTNLPGLPNSLQTLICDNNQLTSLPALPNSITYLKCPSNQLTYLPALPNLLNYLNCSANHITSLPSLPVSLKTLFCYNNQLTNLPALPDSLTTLFCNNNSITCFPVFPNSLNAANSLIISSNAFNCLPNYVSGMDATALSYPLCTTGNTNGCAVSTDINPIQKKNKEIKIYPNPTSNFISIDISNFQNATIVIQNVLGKEIKKLSSVKDINVSDLAEGCYFLQITLSSGENYKTKFIKQ